MAEEPTIAVLVERIGNVQKSIDEVKQDMATKGDQTNTHDIIGRVERALAAEVTARSAAVDRVASRLQLVEDRLEGRKYQFGIAIVLSIAGAVLGVFIR